MSTIGRSLIDEGALERLAAEPAKPLFPILRHAKAMAPLVVVAAFLPSLYAATQRSLTEAGARQGLLALECLSAADLGEFVDLRSAGQTGPEAWQPPLTTWLTAASLRSFGLRGSAGLIGVAYLSAAALVIAGYTLGRRFGGERLGLLAALFLAFHPQVLHVAQQPAPDALATVLAVLTIAAVVAHWQKWTSVASYHLLLGGVALGLCLLAGGPVAIAVVMILLAYAAWWKLEAGLRPHAETTIDTSGVGRKTALRSVLILAATAFALGAWWPFLMGSRYGAEFWSAWWNTAAGGDMPGGEGGTAASWLLVPLAAFAVAGTAGIVVRRVRRPDERGGNHYDLLVVWTAAAAGFWGLFGVPFPVASPVGAPWLMLLLVPIAVLAGCGILLIVDRKVPFWAALAAGLVSLGSVAVALYGAIDRRTAVPVAGVFVILTFAGLAAWRQLAAKPAPSGENPRRRFGLSALLCAFFAVYCVWGVVSIGRTGGRARELEDLRAGLARLTEVRRCTLLTWDESAASLPPPQILYTLRSVWPQASIDRARTWEEIPIAQNSEARPRDRATRIVISWSPRGRTLPAAPAGVVRSAVAPYLYGEYEVAAYVAAEPAEG